MSNYDEFLSQLNREAYHDGEHVWEEDGFTVYRNYPWSAPGCHDSCGLLCYMDKDGRLDHVEGDPLSPVVNGKLCMRCLNMPEATNHPQRLKYPMKRIGERGENKWERISWEEALDIITEKAHYYYDNYGPSALMVSRGTARNIGIASALQAFLAYETPYQDTLFNIGFSCYAPRLSATKAVVGDYWIADASMGQEARYASDQWHRPGVVIIWAVEPLKSNADGYNGHWLAECVQLGTKIICIDPRLTWWGARAEYWLQVRPGTDGQVAMALLHTVINEDLYDHEFVENWTYGFEQLAESVKDATPEWAAEICGVDAEDIRGAARLYATEGPGCVNWGLALEQQDSDPLSHNLAIIALSTICGYVDVPGGMLIVRDAYGVPHHLSEDLLPEGNEDLRCEKRTPDAVWGDQRQLYWHWEKHDEDRVRYMVIESCNSLANTASDPARVFDAFKNLEFVVGADPFLSPTISALADIVIPIAMSIERDTVRSWWTPVRACCKITQYCEAECDEEFGIKIINKMWPERFEHVIPDNRAFQNYRLRQSTELDEIVKEVHKDTAKAETDETFAYRRFVYGGTDIEAWDHEIDFERFKHEMMGFKYDKFNSTYRKYEKGMLRPDGQPGFKTTTGRIELYSLGYANWGQPPVPVSVLPAQTKEKTPELFEKYPLVNISGVRSYEFFHSEHRQQPTMREFHPWPLVCMSPRVAERFGIKEGEWTWVENDNGRFKQIAHIVEGIRDDCITSEHGWWYPEEEPGYPVFYKVFDSNPNNCVDIDQIGIRGIGSATKTSLVTIYPVKEGDITPTEQIILKGGFPVQKARREAYIADWKAKGIENN